MVPDMRGFATRVRKELTGLGPFDVKVRAEVDDKAVKGLRAALKSLPDVVVTADTSAADRDLAALRKRIQTLADHKVGISISADDARREVADIKTDLDRLSGASVSVDADTGAARAALETVSAELSRVDGRTARVRVDVDTAGAWAKIAAFQRQVDSIRNIRAALVYDVRLGPAIRQLSLLTALFLAMPALIGGGTYAIASFGAAIVPAVGSLALLPAAISAVGIAFAGLKVGLSGFGEAMKNLDDPAKFAEAIAKLAPAARSAAVAIREVRPAWTAMQQAVQQQLFAGVAAQIRELSGLYLPILRQGLTETAGSLNRYAAAFTAFATTPQTLADVPVIFGNTNRALTVMTPVLNNVLGAFRDMAVVGSTFLPGLAQSLVNVTQRFQTWIHNARESGQLAIWIQGGIDVLRTLGSIVGNVGSALGGLFRAAGAAGANFLGTLDMLTGQLSTFLNSASGQTALVSLFQNIQGLTTAMAPGIQALFDIIGNVITKLAPVLPQLGEAFSAVVIALGPLVDIVASLISTLLPPLLGFITQFPGAFIGIVLAVMAVVGAYRTLIAVSGVLKAAEGALAVIKSSTLLPVLWKMIAGTWSFVAGLIAQGAAMAIAYWPITLAVVLIGALIAAVIYAWNNFEGFRNVVYAVWDAIKVAFQAIGAAAVWLWQTIFVPAWNAISAAVSWAWTNVISPVLGFIWTGLKYLGAIIFVVLVAPFLIAWNIISAAAVWLWEAVLRPVFQAIGTFIGWVWTALIQPALAALVWFWQYIVTPAALWLWNTIIKPTFQAIGDFISWVWTAIIQPALAALVWFWQQVIAPAARWLYENIIRPMWEGIGNVIRFVWENVIRPAFDAVKQGLQWVGEKFQQATDWIRDIWNRIRGYLAKPINFMIDVVWNKGIVPAWNKVADLVGIGKIEGLPLIPEARTGGRVDSAGMIRGPGTGTSDSILGRVKENDAPLKVSNREFIVNERATRANLPLLTALNGGATIGNPRNERRARRVPGFARGGAVWRGLWDTVRGQFPNARLTSSTRNSNDYHGRGMAIDVAGSYPMAVGQMKDINRWIGTTFPRSTELIHYPLTGGGINIKNGGPHNYNPATQLAHGNHVHWAQDPAQPQGGGNGAANGWQQVSTFFMDAARSAFDTLTNPALDLLRKMVGPPPPVWRDVVPSMATKFRDAARDFVFGKASEKDAQASAGGGAAMMGPVGDGEIFVIQQIADSARARGLGFDGAAIGVATGIVESGLRNLNYGDRDSLGVFQQRPSQGWGSPAQIMNVRYAADKFFNGLMAFNWRAMDPGAAAQRVQRSAFPGRYGQVMPRARQLTAQHGGAFDAGGLASGRGIMLKDVIAPERVLDPDQTADYDVLADYRRMLDDGRLLPTRGLDPRQVALMAGGSGSSGGREMHLHVHGDVNDPMDVDSLYNQIDFRERSARL